MCVCVQGDGYTVCVCRVIATLCVCVCVCVQGDGYTVCVCRVIATLCVCVLCRVMAQCDYWYNSS